MDRSRSDDSDETPKLPIFRIVSLSTAHITREDDTKLSEDHTDDRPWMLSTSTYGWVLIVPDPPQLEQTLQSLKERGYSDAMLKIVLQAHRQQARFLRFDAGEAWSTKWPRFEW